MSSFVAAYKVLSRGFPGCSSHLALLDNVTAGRQSQENIGWVDELRQSLASAQRALLIYRTFTIPRRTDQLWILTDGAVGKPGIGATL